MIKELKFNFQNVSLVIVSAMILYSCASNPSANQLDQVSWLLGSWKTSGSHSNYMTKEIWWMENDLMLGKGLIIKEGDTTFTEKLSFKVVNDTLFYVAEVAHNDSPTYFKLTGIEEETYTFENKTHDFPKMIQYIRKENGFSTLVSGGEQSFSLMFKKDE